MTFIPSKNISTPEFRHYRWFGRNDQLRREGGDRPFQSQGEDFLDITREDFIIMERTFRDGLRVVLDEMLERNEDPDILV